MDDKKTFLSKIKNKDKTKIINKKKLYQQHQNQKNNPPSLKAPKTKVTVKEIKK